MKQISTILPTVHTRYWIDEDGNLYTDNGTRKMSDNYLRNNYISNQLMLIDGTKQHFHRHRLMLLVFLPINNAKEMQVNHIDGNKLNNHLNNLEWVTPRENTIYAHENFLCENSIGENHYNHKLTEQEVVQIYTLVHQGYSLSTLAEKYGVSKRTIGRIRDQESWKRTLLKEGSTTN